MLKHKKLREQIQKENDEHQKLIDDIVRRCKVIRKIYKDKYPKGDYLIIAFSNNSICINNMYWGEDSECPINEFIGGKDEH